MPYQIGHRLEIIRQQKERKMLNWIYYQIAMYYLRKARKVGVNNGRLWLYYMAMSGKWIDKIARSL